MATQMATFPRIAVCLLALAGSAAMVTAAAAQVSCYKPTDQLSAQEIADFNSNSEQLLQRYPNAGQDLIARIRDLAATSPATLQTILKLVATANAAQIDAIGTGLGLAALACVSSNQEFASEIQQAVAGLNNDALTLALAAVLGDKPIGAVGGGGGGGGGGPTSPLFGSTGGFGGSSVFGSFGTANHEPNFFTLSTISGSTPGGSTVTITSVSPSH